MMKDLAVSGDITMSKANHADAEIEEPAKAISYSWIGDNHCHYDKNADARFHTKAFTPPKTTNNNLKNQPLWTRKEESGLR